VTENNRPQRWIFRSIVAFLASFVTVIVLSLGTDLLMHALGLFPGLGKPILDSKLLALAFGYRLLYGVLGGYVIARLAPFAPLGHAVASGVVGMVLSTIGAVTMWGLGPNWYPVALAATALPCAWLGGTLGRNSAKDGPTSASNKLQGQSL
jgi:hypothetical protein